MNSFQWDAWVATGQRSDDRFYPNLTLCFCVFWLMAWAGGLQKNRFSTRARRVSCVSSSPSFFGKAPSKKTSKTKPKKVPPAQKKKKKDKKRESERDALRLCRSCHHRQSQRQRGVVETSNSGKKTRAKEKRESA